MLTYIFGLGFKTVQQKITDIMNTRSDGGVFDEDAVMICTWCRELHYKSFKLDKLKMSLRETLLSSVVIPIVSATFKATVRTATVFIIEPKKEISMCERKKEGLPQRPKTPEKCC